MSDQEENIEQQYTDLIEKLGLKVTSRFVPFSASRNADEENVTLNWKVTFSNSKDKMSVDYSQGIGHLPYPKGYGLSAYQNRIIKEISINAAETGIVKKIRVVKNDIEFAMGQEKLKEPTMQEVLYCLTLDADVRHHLTYKSWADEFGQDSDSIKGEKIYNQCREQTAQLIKLIGGESNLEKLQDILREMDEQSVTVKSTSKPKM